ncbi:MAG: hypothetical protein M1390_00315 [Candidatus Marsarchaeota archaeon]|nr:hypothetical protein [Candidatus Marsarchaeota archaeon]
MAVTHGATAPGWIVLLAVIAIVVTLRLYRAARGTKYSAARVYRLPVFYILFTAVALATISLTLADVTIAVAVFVAGIIVGLRISGGVSFSDRRGIVYYKRSPAVMILWLASFVSRFAIEILYPASHYALLAVALLLAGTTGLILGEALHLKKGYEDYSKHTDAQEQ